MDLGNRIQAARKKVGLTQKALAEKAGVATVTIQQYELGKRQPRLEQLQRIADALGVSMGYLMGNETVNEIIPGRLKIIEVNSPDAKDIRYTLEATDPEAYALGLQIFERAGISPAAYTPQARITAALDKLNEAGQQKAVERVEELTEIPKYQRPAPQTPQDTTPAPEATERPPEGKD